MIEMERELSEGDLRESDSPGARSMEKQSLSSSTTSGQQQQREQFWRSWISKSAKLIPSVFDGSDMSAHPVPASMTGTPASPACYWMRGRDALSTGQGNHTLRIARSCPPVAAQREGSSICWRRRGGCLDAGARSAARDPSSRRRERIRAGDIGSGIVVCMTLAGKCGDSTERQLRERFQKIEKEGK